MAKTSATKPRQVKHKKYMLVRYSRMDLLGFFEHHENRIPKLPTRVVVKTDRGLELGHLVGQLAPYKAGQFRLNEEQIKEYFDNSDIDFSCKPIGRFIRYATAEDISEERHLRKIAREEIKCCRRFAEELKLSMKVVDAEHIFGGERIIYYFMSDGRVDFRELVKKLAQEYQSRIEMRQIGSRDEAKLLGDVESCGQECCCRRFLKALKPVNMRMAKMQKATLDPSKISGYCGRLKCCLRYEDKTYTELKNRLPKRNSIVKTQYGQGKVVDVQILTQLVIVEQESGTRIAVGVEELEIISSPTGKEKDSTTNNDAATDKESTPNNESRDAGESQKQ
ncbi:MAG: PSP1 domain-containing protein [Planctomycetota bacterium]|jgi:cell fate regulator YaaT (PSP1 superfamily)